MSPGSVVYVPDPSFPKEAVRTLAVKTLLEELAKQGAAIYQEGVPVDEGTLRASIFGDVQLTEDGYKGRIGSTDWKAALVELGSSLRNPDGSLRRAIESIGLTFEETRP